jgi:hypothetical protein
VTTKFYLFKQNNSGGRYKSNAILGIGPEVWIEAPSACYANIVAFNLGIYFNGVLAGVDCTCCGDRWYMVDEGDAHDMPQPYADYLKSRHPCAYVHYLNGGIKTHV